jgi:hypothetical protein
MKKESLIINHKVGNRARTIVIRMGIGQREIRRIKENEIGEGIENSRLPET